MQCDKRCRRQSEFDSDNSVDDVRRFLHECIDKEKNQLDIANLVDDHNNVSYAYGKFNVLSLFSGCGGLDLGFILAGIDAVYGQASVDNAFTSKYHFERLIKNNIFHMMYANDIFPEATCTYKVNIGGDAYINGTDIRKIANFPNADIVLGGFPCPGFSEAGPRLIDDSRNFLYLQFIRCLLQVQPYIFVGENVKGMLTLGRGEVFKQIVEDFSAVGYKVHHALVNAVNYGVPQNRERVILVGVRNDVDFEYEFPKLTHGSSISSDKSIRTLRDSIWDLRNDPGCYFTGSYSPMFMSRNRKKSWDEPSFTIQASGRQAPIHPDGEPMKNVGKDKFIFVDGEENNRRLSIKEISRIQTFPDWYDFRDGGGIKRSMNARLDLIYRQIGNAVPVLLAKAIATPIAEWAVWQNC